MFADSLYDSGWANRSHRGWTTLTSFYFAGSRSWRGACIASHLHPGFAAADVVCGGGGAGSATSCASSALAQQSLRGK